MVEKEVIGPLGTVDFKGWIHSSTLELMIVGGNERNYVWSFYFVVFKDNLPTNFVSITKKEDGIDSIEEKEIDSSKIIGDKNTKILNKICQKIDFIHHPNNATSRTKSDLMCTFELEGDKEVKVAVISHEILKVKTFFKN